MRSIDSVIYDNPDYLSQYITPTWQPANLKNLSQITLGKMQRLRGFITTGVWVNNQTIAEKLKSAHLTLSQEKDKKTLEKKVDQFVSLFNKAEIDQNLSRKLAFIKLDFLNLTKELKEPEALVIPPPPTSVSPRKIANETHHLFIETCAKWDERSEEESLKNVRALKEQLQNPELRHSLRNVFRNESELTLQTVREILDRMESDLTTKA